MQGVSFGDFSEQEVSDLNRYTTDNLEVRVTCYRSFQVALLSKCKQTLNIVRLASRLFSEKK